jgi:sulfur-oxidizing protein SoxX
MSFPRRELTYAALAVVLAALAAIVPANAPAAEKAAKSAIEEGKALSFDRSKGNCLACHMIAGGDSPGDIGPPLVGMSARYPDKGKLRAQIFDATAVNPHSVMPPFGRNRILTEEELNKVVDFIHTL